MNPGDWKTLYRKAILETDMTARKREVSELKPPWLRACVIRLVWQELRLRWRGILWMTPRILSMLSKTHHSKTPRLELFSMAEPREYPSSNIYPAGGTPDFRA